MRTHDGSIDLPVSVNLDMTDALVDVAAFRPGCHLKLVMDDEKGQAVAYLVGE